MSQAGGFENGIKELQGGKVWLSRSDGRWVLGVTDAAASRLGELAEVELVDADSSIERGDVVATLEGDHGTLEIVAPVSGRVVEINPVARREPEQILEDPLEEGWLIAIEADDEEDTEFEGNA